MQQLNIGATLQNGKYRIVRVLGQGGFGITYLAVHTLLEKEVAIKEFFPKELCDRDETTSHISVLSKSKVGFVDKLRNKFVKEARNIAKLNHPGIIKIQDVFEENDTAYYVMDYIEGMSLSNLVKSKHILPQKVALKYILGVADALSYIHEHKMMHLDVKPANIMVRASDEQTILIDFGLSKQYDSEGNQTSTTPTGISHGYAPMEQYNEGGVTEFSPQTDEYSLAATLLFTLTGEQPPQAANIIEDGINIPNDVDQEISEAITKAMSPSRKKRYSSVKEFADAIDVLGRNNASKGNGESSDSFDNNYDFSSIVGDDSSTIESDDESHTVLDDYQATKVTSSPEFLQQAILQLDEEVRTKTNELTQKNARIAELENEANSNDSQMSALRDEVDNLKRSNKTAWSVGILGIIVLVIICIATNNSKSSELESLHSSIESLNNTVRSKDSEIKSRDAVIASRDKLIKTVANGRDVFISDVQVRNEGESYDSKIYGKNSTFINPRIKVINLSNNKKTIGIKFYAPYGLATGEISKNGYSYTEDLPANFGSDTDQWFEIMGWGNKEKGSWYPGNYRIEFWVDGKMVTSKSFKVY